MSTKDSTGSGDTGSLPRDGEGEGSSTPELQWGRGSDPEVGGSEESGERSFVVPEEFADVLGQIMDQLSDASSSYYSEEEESPEEEKVSNVTPIRRRKEEAVEMTDEVAIVLILDDLITALESHFRSIRDD